MFKVQSQEDLTEFLWIISQFLRRAFIRHLAQLKAIDAVADDLCLLFFSAIATLLHVLTQQREEV